MTLEATAALRTESLAVRADEDVVRVRQAMRQMAIEAGLTLVDQTKVVTAVSELARNTVVHGGGGTASLEMVREGGSRGVRATFTDEGPGIPDIDLALTDGWTTGRGLGLGLAGSRRLVDDFVLESEPGRGTRASVVKWCR